MSRTARLQAFEILGIEPTADLKAVRAAYRRLARIYHPDRFADAEGDVRDEAQRRMKLVSTAYDVLRTPEEPPPARVRANGKDPWEQAREHREAIRRRRSEAEASAARWRLWEQLEEEARLRAERDAEMAAALSLEEGAASGPITRVVPETPPPDARKKSALELRLEAARGHGNGLAVRYDSQEERSPADG